MTELHEVGGAEEMFPVELWVDQPGHLLGTARMGDDPERSVTDSFGRTHDCPNLFVADGGPFVSQADKNPTWTILALSWRTSDFIAQQRKAGAI